MRRLPTQLQERARELRKSGSSFADISRQLSVSYATARRWSADVPLSPRHRAALNEAVEAARTKGNTTVADRSRTIRRRWQEEGRSRARESDPLHLAGCMLFWAEGSKLRNSLTIANSDPQLMSLFMAFLRQEFPQYLDGVTFRLHVYTGNGLTIEQVESFWLSHLGLPNACVRKHSINNRPAGRGGLKKNKLPYGVATLAIHRTHAVQHVWGAIQEYGGFEEARYLDL